MSHRVAVMSGGRVEQAGTPREMYEEPATLFVADFLGVSNLIGAVVGFLREIALSLEAVRLETNEGA